MAGRGGLTRAWGALAVSRGDWRSATKHLQAALRVHETDPAAWEGLGRAYMARGMTTSAQNAFVRALDLATVTTTTTSATIPGSPVPSQVPGSKHRLYPMLALGALHLTTGELDLARERFTAALGVDTQSVPALVGLAQTLLASADQQRWRGGLGVASRELASAQAAAWAVVRTVVVTRAETAAATMEAAAHGRRSGHTPWHSHTRS